MNRARKSAIVEKARPVPEIASEIADALNRTAEAFETFAGIAAYIAAAEHTETAGEQRQLAAVMYQTAVLKFGGVKYDGKVIDEATIAELDEMWCKFFKIDPRKLKGGR